jgi:diadenosine tetraphosphate (Ap4A) HIT family hydrolase
VSRGTGPSAVPAGPHLHDPACAVCGQHADARAAGHVLWTDGIFMVLHHPEPSPLAGWLRLDAVRHVGGVADLGDDEAARFGVLHARIAACMKAALGVDRVYSIAFGESARHLHMHLVPRYAERGDLAAWSLADGYRACMKDPSTAADAASVQDARERFRGLLAAAL